MSKKKKLIRVESLPDKQAVSTRLTKQGVNLAAIDAMCRRKEIDPNTRDLIFNIIWSISQPAAAKRLENLLHDKGSFGQMFPYADAGLLFRLEIIPKEIADEINKLAQAKMSPIH
jgi:hypothetical protein